MRRSVPALLFVVVAFTSPAAALPDPGAAFVDAFGNQVAA
jgi:hypothetical protein